MTPDDKGTTMGRSLADTGHIGEIIEVAPGDLYVRCKFMKCTFVGVGPAKFVECRLTKCPSVEKVPKVELEKCSFTK